MATHVADDKIQWLQERWPLTAPEAMWVEFLTLEISEAPREPDDDDPTPAQCMAKSFILAWQLTHLWLHRAVTDQTAALFCHMLSKNDTDDPLEYSLVGLGGDTVMIPNPRTDDEYSALLSHVENNRPRTHKENV